MDFRLTKLVALLWLGSRLCIAQSKQHNHRHRRQKIYGKGKMPISCGNPTHRCRSQHQREIIYRRADTELSHSTITRKVAHHKTCRVGNCNTCTCTHNAACNNQQTNILCKDAHHSTRKKYRQTNSEQFQRFAS